MGLLAALERVNAAHPWSHNEAFTPFVLRHARVVRRAGGTTAVDVGCGAGGLVRALAGVLPDVVGVEPDRPTAALAERRTAGLPGVRVVTARFGAEPATPCDLVVFVASLHHLPLEEALVHARSSLRPGGRVVVVGVARETRADLPRSTASLLLNPVVGLLRHPRRAAAPPPAMTAPTQAPSLTLGEIRAAAGRVLPGIRFRRRLFWRYTASWVAPG